MALLITDISASLYFLSPILLSRVYDLPPSLIGFAMVPAAVASAFLGRKGGRLADVKGNSTLFYTASGSLILGFALLSSFTGTSPYLIAFFLIFGNVGQCFMQIAMTNSISRTLPKDRIGVGMGMFSMLSFMSQGMATAVYGRVVDVHATSPWNPLNGVKDSSVFSNIYLVLTALHIGLLAFYVPTSGNKRNQGI